MKSILMVLFMSSFISFILFLISFLNSSWKSDSLKVSPLESGFWVFFENSFVFSLQFFSFLIIFVLFDLELILICSLIVKNFCDISFLFLIAFLIVTLFLEFFLGKTIWEF